MYKKTLLSVAIASSIMALTGCLQSNNESPKDVENERTFTNPGTADPVSYATSSYPIFSPATGDFPTPNDLLIQQDNDDTSAIEQSDGSYAIPGSDAEDASPPVVALENLSGASLTAPIDVEISVGQGKSLDASTVNGTSFLLTGATFPTPTVAPNPAQSVFLLELDYASDNPIAALSISEPPTLPEAVTFASQALEASEDATIAAAGTAARNQIEAIAAAPKYDAKVITRNKDGAEATYIRITPLQPLNPGKRYVVVLTDDIKTDDGVSLIRHPGAAAYGALSDTSVGLASTALEPVQSIINNLWEAVAVNYFALPNGARADDAQLAEENIIFSISFTTSNDTKVVDYMVEPNTWIADTLASRTKLAAAATSVAGGSSSYDEVKADVDEAYNRFLANTIAPTNTTLTDSLTSSCPESTFAAGAAQYACAGAALEGIMTAPTSVGGLGLTLPKPAADTTISFNTPRNVRTVSAFVTDSYAPLVNEVDGGGDVTRAAVNIAEGLMSIPYFSGVPDTRGVSDGSEAALVNEWWKADASIATAVNALLQTPGSTAPVLPQALTTGTNYVQSDIVNSFFPFPAKNSDEEIPVLAVFPASDSEKPTNGYKTLIYQHGITTDRSVALALGTAIVSASGGTVAVLAIDQPLHGIDAISEQGQLDLAAAFLAAGQSAGLPTSVAPGDANNQAVVDGTLATSFVTTTLTASNYVAAALSSNSLIDISDGISATESVMITETIEGNLSEVFVAQTIAAAVGSGYDASDYPNNLDPTEQAVVTNMVSGTNVTGNSALDSLAAQMPTLDATSFAVLENLGQTLTAIQTVDANATTLVSSAFTGELLETYLAFMLSLDPTALSQAESDLIDSIIAGTADAVTYGSAMAISTALASGFTDVESAGQGLALMQTTVANGASQVPGLGQGDADERHFGFGAVSLNPVPMDFTDGTVGTSSSDNNTNTGSGAMTINIASFLTARDNFRQGIVDLMALRLSIPTMDLDSDGTPDLDTNSVHFLAHSLGTFNGIPFVEIANNTATTADDIISANFLTPGGNIARLAENSPVFAPSILLGLGASGLSRGDADVEAFLNTMQASLDSFDPINFVGGLSSTASTTKALFSEVVGDVFIPNNAVPAADIVQPTTLYAESVTDGVYSQTPITNPVGGVSFGEGIDAPLAGTSPLQTISGATSIDASGALGINFIRFNRTNDDGDVITAHTTPAAAVTAEEGPSFAEFVSQATSMVVSDGASIAVTTTPGLIVDADD